MYQEQYSNIKYSDFINEFNKFVSSNFKITNVNQSTIKNQLLFFINLSLIKGIHYLKGQILIVQIKVIY